MTPPTTTKVDLKQDGLDIKLNWQVGDVINLLTVDSESEKTTLDYTVTALNPDGTIKTYTLSDAFPEGTFDLYGVYGGRGIFDEDKRLAIMPLPEKAATSWLQKLAENKAFMLAFERKGITQEELAGGLDISLQHIGSLFNIKLKNTGASPLNKVTHARLVSSTPMPAFEFGNTYNLVDKQFVGAKTTTLTFLPVSSSNIVPGGILEFWGWIPMEKNAEWPALTLEVISSGPDLTSTNSKAARTATVGKVYYLFATYDGTSLQFVPEGQEEATMTVEAGKLADFRDGNLYNTVQIGEQIWMKENLKFLPSVVSSATLSTWEPLYYVNCYINTDVAGQKTLKITTCIFTIHTVFVQLASAMAGATSSNDNPSGVQGVCPPGWHLPSETEWQQLETHLGMLTVELEKEDIWERGVDEGKKLKEPEAGGHWTPDPIHEGTNASGFTALPAGYMGTGSTGFYGLFNYAGFWSATAYDGWDTWTRMLSYNKAPYFVCTNHTLLVFPSAA